VAARLAKQRRQLSPTEDGAKATTGCGWLLKRDEEATCILMYVGGVEIAKNRGG